jgi:magnesium chelatase family protein
VARYRGRISGPLLDRIDMTIEVPRLPAQALQESGPAPAESSTTVRARVEQCRQRQLTRNGCPNSQLAGRRLDETCSLSAEARQLITRAMDQLGLSARAYHRILRLARTIADLVQSDTIHTAHLSEAIGYRRQDRRN